MIKLKPLIFFLYTSPLLALFVAGELYLRQGTYDITSLYTILLAEIPMLFFFIFLSKVARFEVDEGFLFFSCLLLRFKIRNEKIVEVKNDNKEICVCFSRSKKIFSRRFYYYLES